MKFRIPNRLVVAFVIGGVLLVGTSLPSNAQQQETQQQDKQEKVEQQQEK